MKRQVLSKLPSVRVREVAASALRLYFAPLRVNPPYEGGDRRSKHRIIRVSVLLAATLGAAFGASLLLLSPPFGESIVTTANQWEAMRLEDGSVVYLGPKTRMNVRYSVGYRRIYLKRGKARFEVAHAPSRPFEVITGVGEARAVGTEFGVDYSPPHKAEITVIKGTVNVKKTQRDPAAGEADGEYLLVAGERASLSDGKIDISRSVDTRGVHWEGDKVRIEGATIGEVAAELNLRGQRIVVDDPSVAAIIIPVMSFSRYETQRFVERMASSPNIAKYERDGVVHLKSRQGPCAPWLICGDAQ